MRRKCATYVSLITSLLVASAHQHADAQSSPPRDQQVKIVAPDMCCASCARKVTSKLFAARGVKSVETELETRTLTVTLPQQGGASLAQLWSAVHEGDGGPSQLTTPDATYTWTTATSEEEPRHKTATTSIVIDNLHCMGCAQKIGRQLYAMKGVTKVSADLPHDTLIVATRPDVAVSAWQVVDAVMKADERPLAITTNLGTLSVEWATERAPKNHPAQAHQSVVGAFQR